MPKVPTFPSSYGRPQRMAAYFVDTYLPLYRRDRLGSLPDLDPLLIKQLKQEIVQYETYPPTAGVTRGQQYKNEHGRFPFGFYETKEANALGLISYMHVRRYMEYMPEFR